VHAGYAVDGTGNPDGIVRPVPLDAIEVRAFPQLLSRICERLSQSHEAFLNIGGLGILVGDGM
jgi:hypothetical protein